MFKNIGGKIKGLAAFFAWVGIIGSILGGIGLMIAIGDEIAIIAGIGIAVAGSLVSWIGSFLLYGFGQLIYNSDIIAKNTQSNYNPVQFLSGVQQPVAPAVAQTPVYAPVAHQWKCEGCGNMIDKEICPVCGKAHGKVAERISVLQSLYSDGTITQEDYNAKLEQIRNERI